jgi:hypothetical protein
MLSPISYIFKEHIFKKIFYQNFVGIPCVKYMYEYFTTEFPYPFLVLYFCIFLYKENVLAL